MLSRYLTNASEFAVDAVQPHGMPSISRSASSFKDNSYWRGRAWGPMNMLVYLGLKEYSHLESVRSSMAMLGRQSEATFLVEWVGNHRVMENFNSVTGEGCDVHNAIPFCEIGSAPACDLKLTGEINRTSSLRYVTHSALAGRSLGGADGVSCADGGRSRPLGVDDTFQNSFQLCHVHLREQRPVRLARP
eukprot:SAG11_NODE_4252_length_1985_cov_1.644751_2_plen_190_part_00